MVKQKLIKYYEDELVTIYNGDALKVLKQLLDEHVQCCVTSPPYWRLRDYKVKGQLGLEKTPEEYIKKLVIILRELKRVLKKDGVLWLNLGDSYNGSQKGRGDTQRMYSQRFVSSGKVMDVRRKGKPTNVKSLKPKNLIGIPWRVALALQTDGWYLRQDIIWSKPNPMPEAVKDRCTKSHEYIFLLTKSAKYYYDADAIQEPVSPNTHKRISRENKKTNKTKPRTPKAQKVPSGWNTGEGSHDTIIGRYPKIKNNKSFDAALKIMPENRNKRSVWTVATKSYAEAHFAVFPPELIIPCIKAGSREKDIVLDPFGGSGTTADVSKKLGRKCISIELKQEYCELHKKRWPNYELQL